MKTKKRWGRKGFALFLALLLALSPAAAFAEGTEGADESQKAQTVEATKATEPEPTAEETQKTKPETTETKAPEKETEKTAEETKPEPAPSESASEAVKTPSASDKQEEPEQKAETCTVTFNVNHPQAGTITAEGSVVSPATYQKKLEKGKAFRFTAVPNKGWEIDSVTADGRDVAKTGENGYILKAVEQDTEITVQYQKAETEEADKNAGAEKKPEAADDVQKDTDEQAVPEVVQTFLDAVAQIPATIISANMEKTAELLYGTCADAYEELLGTEYEGRADVQAAAKIYEAAVKKFERFGEYTSESYASSQTITVNVRIYDLSTGATYNIGTEKVSCGDPSLIQSVAYQIPQLSHFVDPDSFGKVTKVAGNWYFPMHDTQPGANIEWSTNASTKTMTYWVNWYQLKSAGEGSDSGGTETVGGGSKAPWSKTIVYHSNYPNGTDYEYSVTYTIKSYVQSREISGNLKTFKDTGFTVPKGYKTKSPVWNVQKDGKGTSYGSGGTYYFKPSDSGTLHLFAQYEPDGLVDVQSVTLTYKDGNDEIGTRTYDAGDEVTAISHSKDGYTLLGWSETPNGEVKYTAGQKFTIGQTMILYAVWQENAPADDTYTVIYRDSEEYGGTVLAEHTGLKEGDSTPGYSSEWFEGKDKDFYTWSPKRENTVGGDNHTIVYTAVYKNGTYKYPFRIYYQWSGASDAYKTAAPDYVDELERGDSYDVPSPELNVPFEYSVNYPRISGTVGYTTSDIKYWVTYTPIVKVNHIYRTNGEVTATVPDTVTRQVPFGGTLNADSWGVQKRPSYDGKQYTFTSADAVTLPTNPAELTEQPVLNLYYDRTEATEAEKHKLTVHYEWNVFNGSNIKAKEDLVKEYGENERYFEVSPNLNVPFAYTINPQQILGYMGNADEEKTVTYSPGYQIEYICRTNGEVTLTYKNPTINAGMFNASYTIPNYVGTDIKWSNGDVYQCTKVEAAVFPADPAELEATPVLRIYGDRTVPTDETVTITVKFVDEDGKVLREETPIEVKKGESYDVSKTTGLKDDGVGTITIDEKTYTTKLADGSAPVTGEADSNKTITVVCTPKTEEIDPPDENGKVKLTFVVVNGSWNDETKASIETTVTLNENGSYTIADKDVPAVGERPDAGYKAGSWDTVPSGAITENMTYTYTYERIETDPTNPTNPTNPSQPTNPTNPTDPSQPTDPTTPSQPTDPTDPTTPSEPTDPTNPTDPTDPATPTDPTDPQDPTEPTTPVTPVGPTTPTDPGTPSDPNTPNTPADPNGPAGTTGGTATVANVPTVTPAAIPAVAALAPAAAPAAPAAAAPVADDAVPLAAEPEGVTTLADDGVPLAKGPDGAWALLNFALMNLAIFECLMLLIGYFIKTKGAAEEEEEEHKKLKKKGVMRIISLPIAAISIIAFCLTEDITLSTAIVDRYTLLMAIIALVQTVAVVLSRKELKDETDDETEERAVA